MKLNKQMKSALIIVVALSLSACLGKGKSQDQVSVDNSPQGDMTRPPNTIGNSEDKVEESNPDETISFEEWKKEQDSDE